jgi:hypothetical protein
MTKHINPTPVTDEQIRILLERYHCPVPFHAMRTRFPGTLRCWACRLRRLRWLRTYGVASCRPLASSLNQKRLNTLKLKGSKYSLTRSTTLVRAVMIRSSRRSGF